MLFGAGWFVTARPLVRGGDPGTQFLGVLGSGTCFLGAVLGRFRFGGEAHGVKVW